MQTYSSGMTAYTENYSKKPYFRSNKSRHCAYIIYRVKTRFKKKDVTIYFVIIQCTRAGQHIQYILLLFSVLAQDSIYNIFCFYSVYSRRTTEFPGANEYPR